MECVTLHGEGTAQRLPQRWLQWSTRGHNGQVRFSSVPTHDFMHRKWGRLSSSLTIQITNTVHNRFHPSWHFFVLITPEAIHVTSWCGAHMDKSWLTNTTAWYFPLNLQSSYLLELMSHCRSKHFRLMESIKYIESMLNENKAWKLNVFPTIWHQFFALYH